MDIVKLGSFDTFKVRLSVLDILVFDIQYSVNLSIVLPLFSIYDLDTITLTSLSLNFLICK